MSNLGEAIKVNRAKREMSLHEVAIEAGITKAHVWEMERGTKSNPTIKTILGLAIALDLDPGALALTAMADLPRD